MKQWVLAGLFDEPDVQHFSMVQQELAYQNIVWFPPPAAVAESKEEFKDYNAPTLVITATNDVFFEGEGTAARARELFGEDTEILIVEGKHVPAPAKMIKVPACG